MYDDGSHPIVINSGYRSEEVNKRVGGSPTSNHLILLNYADDSDQEFDELLIERSKKGTYWVHFAVRKEGNRMKVAFLRG